MLRSLTAFGLLTLAAVACTKTSESQRIVSAPVSSAAPQVAAAPSSEGPATLDETDGGPPQFRACQTDADCVAVPLDGCCHNGWMVAVNAGQKDPYAQSFTCPTPRPICPMYIVRDTRVPKCDPSSHLCTMVKTQP